MTKFKFLILIFYMFSFSCSDSNLNVQIVRHSSELLTCDKIFADNLKAIEERNEILLQTGAIDTTDEQQPIKSAIVTINKIEIALTLQNSATTNNETIETYKGHGYDLTLTFKSTIGQYNKLVYTGNFTIKNSTAKREFAIEGKNCVL